ncbi:hypothetical protein CEXT_592541 [Caerostris extrusa]|uniref:Uncharacterized protein n=1 Tax=Caerostris extrusa TaxID=172846 RepID=A0AAV4TY86_CAEEX|nr:hypothetical protein CEXT_592541 [Caerostris extrusa]
MNGSEERESDHSEPSKDGPFEIPHEDVSSCGLPIPPAVLQSLCSLRDHGEARGPRPGFLPAEIQGARARERAGKPPQEEDSEHRQGQRHPVAQSSNS